MEKRRILIIDDEPKFTRMVKLNLERTGEFEVCEENRATSAVTTARNFRPHLIILDVIMPSLDGGDVAKLIKLDKELRDTPIIFLTAAVSHKEAGRKGLASGGELFLAKPISLEDLVQCIHENVRRDEPESTDPPANPEI